MKKKLLALIIAIVSAAAVFAFAGCGWDERSKQKVDATADVYIEVQKIAFTANGNLMPLNHNISVKNYMEMVSSGGRLIYEMKDGLITSFYNTESKVISSTATSYEGYDWAFYIDFTALEGDDAIYATDYKTIEYGGKTLYAASYGVEGTPCVDGHTYVFVYEYSNFSW